MSIYVHVHLKLPGNDPEGALSDVREALGEGLDDFDYESLSAAKAGDDLVAAAVAEMPMAKADALQAVAPAVALPFKVGQLLTADGDKLHGEVKVIACWNSKSVDKPKYDRPQLPYPQVEVQPIRGGQPWHFHGDDIRQGKLIAK